MATTPSPLRLLVIGDEQYKDNRLSQLFSLIRDYGLDLEWVPSLEAVRAMIEDHQGQALTENNRVAGSLPFVFAQDSTLALTSPSERLRISNIDADDNPLSDASEYRDTLRAVTERLSVQERKQLREFMLETTSDGVLIADASRPDKPVLYVNPAFERITGYSAEETLGRDCFELQSNKGNSAQIGVIREALAERHRCEAILHSYRKDETFFWSRFSLCPLRNEQGNVTYYIGVITDLTERLRYESELAYLTSHDALTDLPRLSLVEDYVTNLLTDAVPAGSKVALLYLDLDRFHSVNETMGRHVGDRAIRLFAARLQAEIGDQGRVARVAGDEFLAAIHLKPGSTEPEVLAQKLREHMELPIPAPPYTLYLSCSIGISVCPEHGQTAGDLVQSAEAAMKRAKRRGGSSVMLFSNEQAIELRDRLEIGSRLRDAIRNDELRLHYQPQANAQSGRIVGLEALVRWQSQDRGLLWPDRFTHVAEELGLIVDLGLWVLEEAAQQVRLWRDAGYDDIHVTINVSSVQLQRPDFAADVIGMLSRYKVPPGAIEVDITESALLENIDTMAETMQALKSIGIRIALDDFGSGHSSLRYLRRFPIDKLKIDRSFVKDVSTESGEAAIARGIIALGHQLRMSVLAEGVETEAQLGYLRRNHCDEVQGFLLGGPMSADEAERLLRHRYLLPEAFAATRPDQTLLLVDDEENVLRSLTRLFRRDGYRIITATGADQAFEALARNNVQVILSDQRMPGVSGTEFLGKVKDLYPETIRLVLSGYTDLATVTEAINEGAIYKFLTKPWNDGELRTQIQEAFRSFSDRAHAVRAV